MLNKLKSVLGLKDDNGGDDNVSRRAYPRRDSDRCIGVINGTIMPVADWSQGGLRVLGDARLYAVGQEMDVVMKFKLADDLVSIPQRGQVVRKAQDGFSIKFMPMSQEVRGRFQRVLSDIAANEQKAPA